MSAVAAEATPSVEPVQAVTAAHVESFLAAHGTSTLASPASFVFADIVATRAAAALQNRGLGESLVADAFRSTQRNNFFCAVFHSLLDSADAQSEHLPQLDTLSERNRSEGEAPLWTVVDALVNRRLQAKTADQEAWHEADARAKEATEARWQAFWAHYRRKADEPKATQAQLRVGAEKMCPSTPRRPTLAEDAIKPLTARSWMTTSPRLKNKLEFAPGTRMALIDSIYSPVGTTPSSARDVPGARDPGSIAVQILRLKRQFEERLVHVGSCTRSTSHSSHSDDVQPHHEQELVRKTSSMREHMPTPLPVTAASHESPPVEKVSQPPAASTPRSRGRSKADDLELPRLKVPERRDETARYRFKSYEDYKQRKELLCSMPPPSSRPSSLSAERAALRNNRLARETLQDVAQQQRWPLAAQEYLRVRQSRGKSAAAPLSARAAEGRLSPAPADFHRPWSREGTRCVASPEACLAPMQRFAKVCLTCGLHPQAKSVQFLMNLPPTLDIRAAGYSDEDLLALTASLPFEGGIEAVDMGENSRLSNSAVCGLLKELAKRHKDSIAKLALDHCARLGKETVTLCTKLLDGTFRQMQQLILSGITISMHEYTELAAAIEAHPQIHTVHLAKTGLGFFSKSLTAQVIRSIISNRCLTELELGWNSLSRSAFEVLAKGLVENQHVVSLGLASTGPCADADSGHSPLLIFLELLHGDAQLTHLDISNNVLDGNAPVLLEHSVRHHPRLQFIDISRNPLGPDGMRSLMRMLVRPECPELTRIAAQDCAGGRSVGDWACLFDVDPSGSYTLNMAHPAQRAVLQLLLRWLTDRAPGASFGSFFKDAVLAVGSKETPFNFENCKRGKAPQTGNLRFELSVSSVLLQSADKEAHPAEVVARIAQRSRMKLGEHKTLAVLAFIKSMTDETTRRVLLDALGRDVLLSAEQVEALCYSESKHLVSHQDPGGAACCLLPTFFHALDVRRTVACTVSFGDLVRIHRSGRWLLSLNLENPTGYYDLSLSEPMDRSTAERLLLLNRWQFQLWRAAGMADLSQHENGKSMRNEVYDGRAFTWKSEEWHPPLGGGGLSFDYVSLSRPPQGAKAVADEAWNAVLACVKSAMSQESARRSSCWQMSQECARRSSCWQERPQAMAGEDVLWALRAASGRFFLEARQLRKLLCLFPGSRLRSEALAYFFLRCVDWPVNSKLCRAKFTQGEWAELRKRLGHINLFPYFQPECFPVSLDLEEYEQRRVVHFLVKLSITEQHKNIKKPRIDKNKTGTFEPFTAGIPMSWDQFESIPSKGIVEFSYMCSMENARLRFRRRLAAGMAGWSALPEEVPRLQATVTWWAVLEDVPVEAVLLLVFLISNFKDMDEVFDACDSNKDGMLNLKEFSKKLLAMGCARGLPSDLTASGAKEGPEEVLTTVFRFMDTANDGDISKRQFEVLTAIWRELSQSMWEFRSRLLDTYGSLEKGWFLADLEEGVMPYSSFLHLASTCDFRGPLRHIFLYLDSDGAGSISQNQWMKLQRVKAASH